MSKEITLIWLDPEDAQLNPENWRIHQQLQLDSLEALIFDDGDGVGAVGWAGAALVNNRKVEDGWSEEEAVPTFIDGHARHKLASMRGEQMPAIVGSWSQFEERTILATLDPLAGMAGEDKVILSNLKFEAAPQSEALKGLLGRNVMAQDLASASTIENAPEPGALLTYGKYRVPLTPLEQDILGFEAHAYVEEFGMAHGFLRTLLDRRDRDLAAATGSDVPSEELGEAE